MTRRFCFSAAILLLLSLLAARTAQPGRVEGAFTGADAFELHYTAIGSGAPVVLLAGGPGFSGDYLMPIASALDGFQSIVFDQRGTGRSRRQGLDDERITLKQAVADLEALRVHLAQDRLVLVGHSWGGMLAMAYAAQHPRHVGALILIGPGGPNLDFHDYFTSNINARLTAADREAAEFWSVRTHARESGDRAAIEAFRAMLPGYVYERSSALPLVEALRDGSFSQRTNDLMTADLFSAGYDLTHRFEGFDAPVLIVQGRQDPMGETTAMQVRDVFGSAELRFLEECGHFPWLERPAEFAAVIGRFARSLG
jgi:proline iminopeptidase